MAFAPIGPSQEPGLVVGEERGASVYGFMRVVGSPYGGSPFYNGPYVG